MKEHFSFPRHGKTQLKLLQIFLTVLQIVRSFLIKSRFSVINFCTLEKKQNQKQNKRKNKSTTLFYMRLLKSLNLDKLRARL